MDCIRVRDILQDAIDGRLPDAVTAEVRGHLAACPACAAEEAAYLRVGEELRNWTAASARARAPQLDATWTRVRAGIEEGRGRGGSFAWIRTWFWIPVAAALAVLALLFYPSGVNRTPFHPRSFDVSVEDLESDTATVALVDRGEDLPRVIWIIDNDKT